MGLKDGLGPPMVVVRCNNNCCGVKVRGQCLGLRYSWCPACVVHGFFVASPGNVPSRQLRALSKRVCRSCRERNMKSRTLRPRTLAVAIAALVAASGLSADKTFASSPVYTDDSGTTGQSTLVGLSGSRDMARYIVRFVELPMARYNSIAATQPVNGIGPIPLKTTTNGRTRLDVNSAQADNYIQYLTQQQTQHLSDIATALGHSPKVNLTMQSALNAAIIDMTPQEAAKVAKVNGVVAVERDRPHPLATDIGPGFIGAASVWWGTPAGQDTLFASGFDNNGGYRGDGIVIGDIDTGYNSKSPSFQPTDANGYKVTNPLGTGNFLGQCTLGAGVAGISLAGCNDKVIGAYDEIDLTSGGTTFSVEDTQGHGSHTASTAAGDLRSATLSGYTANVSGVAPHANLVIYYACSPNPLVQCSTAATTASVNQAIQDGVVNALNYSISGGTDPWNDSTSLAFLSAADAGIFVAAAAGNGNNPLPGSANHAEPWVTTVAAGTHTGGAIGPYLSLTGPVAPPPSVQNIPLAEGQGDTPPTATITAPMDLSPTFTASNDGCVAFPANQFTGAIALVKRGGCTFVTKVNNAVAVGAVTVVISNSVAGTVTPYVPGTTVPVYSVTLAQGTALKTFLAANSNTAPAVIPYPSVRQPTQPDRLAGFSLLGPVGINVIKPDVQAPGVNILASIANDGSANGPNLVALYNGTSMATPHTSGSGGLLLGRRPTWTAQEVRSALMMTAQEAGLTKPNGVTPSDFFDRGSGRLQDYLASNAGLVLNETGANFDFANPAIGGDASSLNLASLQNLSCINSCTLSRRFRSTQDHTVTWTPSFIGVTPTVAPSSFPVGAGLSHTFTVLLNSSTYMSDGSIHLGELVLTPSDPSLVKLHLPLAISVPPPTIAASPNPLAITGVGVASSSANLTVSNKGGPTLTVTQDTTTTAAAYVINDQPTPFTYGYTSAQYVGRSPGDNDFFGSDDFTITGSNVVNLSLIVVPGFTQTNSLSSFGPNLPVHWRIYSDAGGKPSSDPDTAGPAVWSFDSTAADPNVDVSGDTITLFVSGATALAPGHYWLVVYPTLPCLDRGRGCTNQWYWLTSSTGSGSPAVTISVAPPASPSPWTPIDPTTGAGLAMHLESNVSCAPPSWLSQTGLPASIGGAGSTIVTTTATAPLGAATATGYLCLGSNDAVTPLLPVQVNAAQ